MVVTGVVDAGSGARGGSGSGAGSGVVVGVVAASDLGFKSESFLPVNMPFRISVTHLMN
jgi:hypothetical protein